MSILIKCETCEKEFKTFPSRLKNGRGRFCSKECMCTGYKCRRCKINLVEECGRLCKFCSTTRKCSCCHQILPKSDFDGNNNRCLVCSKELDKISCRICLNRFNRNELDENRYCKECALKVFSKSRKCKKCKKEMPLNCFEKRKRNCVNCNQQIIEKKQRTIDKKLFKQTIDKSFFIKQLVNILNKKIGQYQFCIKCNTYYLTNIQSRSIKKSICYKCRGYNSKYDIPKIKCEICGNRYQHLSGHLVKHNIPVEEYKKQFQVKEICSKAVANALHITNQIRDKCYKYKLSEKSKLFWVNNKEQMCEKLKNAQNTLVAKENHRNGAIKYNKNLSEDQKEQIKEIQRSVWRDPIKRANRIKGIHKPDAMRIRSETGRKNIYKVLYNLKVNRITSIHRNLSERLIARSIIHENEYKFDYYSIDIAIPYFKIAIECDGDYWHANPAKYQILSNKQKQAVSRDKSRNTYLKNKGWVVLRFWETDINQNIEKCVQEIVKVIEEKQNVI